METQRQYAVRMAARVKDYKRVLRESGVGEDAYEWYCKFARGEIPNPGSDRVEKLCRYFKLHEAKQRRKAA